MCQKSKFLVNESLNPWDYYEFFMTVPKQALWRWGPFYKKAVKTINLVIDLDVLEHFSRKCRKTLSHHFQTYNGVIADSRFRANE